MTSATSLQKTLALDRRNLLRIYAGKGLRLTPASGVLWITEEQNPAKPDRASRIDHTWGRPPAHRAHHARECRASECEHEQSCFDSRRGQ
jgi:hypothetical protein